MGLPWDSVLAHGSPTELPWGYLDSTVLPWASHGIHGFPMGLPWVPHGNPIGLQFTLLAHVSPMEAPWGRLAMRPWDSHGFVVLLWDPHETTALDLGTPMGCPYVGLPWGSPGRVVLPWVYDELAMGLPWDFHGPSMGLSCACGTLMGLSRAFIVLAHGASIGLPRDLYGTPMSE